MEDKVFGYVYGTLTGSKPGKTNYFGKIKSKFSGGFTHPCEGVLEFNGSTLIFTGEDSNLGKKVELKMDMKQSFSIKKKVSAAPMRLRIFFKLHGAFSEKSHEKLIFSCYDNYKKPIQSMYKEAINARNIPQNDSDTGTLRFI